MGLLLLAFLAVHGHAGVVRQWLGATHRHDGGQPVLTVLSSTATRAAPAAANARRTPLAGWLSTLRAWQQDHHVRSHAEGLSRHEHRHLAFERHHHDIGDASVVALDDGGAAGHSGPESPAAATALGADLPPGLTSTPALPGSAVAPSAGAWPQAQTRRWQNALARLPERPPRA